MGRRLFVGNLSFHTTDTALKEHFSQAGNEAADSLTLTGSLDYLGAIYQQKEMDAVLQESIKAKVPNNFIVSGFTDLELGQPEKKEATEAEKAELQLKGQQKKESLISDLARKGLFFSGKKDTGLQRIDAETLSKTFGVDRKFALLMASGLEAASQKIMKEAQKGNQDAQEALKALGYVAVPDGEGGYSILPSFEAQKYAQTEERLLSSQDAQQRRFEETQASTQARFEQSQTASQARFDATYARLVANNPTNADIEITADMVNRGELALAEVPATQRTSVQKKVNDIQLEEIDGDISAAIFTEGGEVLDSEDFFAKLRGAYTFLSDKQIRSSIEQARKEREMGYTTIRSVPSANSTIISSPQKSFWERLFGG